MYGIVAIAVIAFAISIILAGFTAVSNSSIKFHELAKQFAVWLGITALLPLVGYFGTAAFTPVPDDEEFERVQSRLNEQLHSTSQPAEKETLRRDIGQRAKHHADEQHLFERRMFWVGYPVGLLAIVIGIFVPVQAVGAGLMFGGIGTLTTGCYESWEYLGRWMRLNSLLLALIVIIVLGLLRFRRARDDAQPKRT